MRTFLGSRTLRRVLFLVHLCVGLVAGVYVVVVCVTGAALVFRLDLQRTLSPHLFAATPGPALDLATMLQSVQAAYPADVVSGIDAPTAARPTVLAYITRGRDFLTVFADPATGRVLGELPGHRSIRILQDLHFNLLSGRPGRVVNGIGAACLLVMCATGLMIWWPGATAWRRGFTVAIGRGWKRAAFDLHGAVGVWTVLSLTMWAATGIYFVFPAQARALVDRVSPLSSAAQVPSSDATLSTRQARRAPGALIAEASRHMPGRYAARVVLPTNERAAVQVLFARVSPTPLTPGALEAVYLDQYTGTILHAPDANPSAGDRLLSWLTPLHVGNFAGRPVQVLWFVLGLAPALLFATGVSMWWNRSVRQQWARIFGWLSRDNTPAGPEGPRAST